MYTATVFDYAGNAATAKEDSMEAAVDKVSNALFPGLNVNIRQIDGVIFILNKPRGVVYGTDK
jgi:hypothetical protein